MEVDQYRLMIIMIDYQGNCQIFLEIREFSEEVLVEVDEIFKVLKLHVYYMLVHLHITTLLVPRFNGLNEYARFDMYYSWSRYFINNFFLFTEM